MNMYGHIYARVTALIFAIVSVAGLSAPADAVPKANDMAMQDQEGITLLGAASTLCFGAEAPSGDAAAIRSWSEYEPAAGEPLAGMLGYWRRDAALQKAELTQFQLYKGMIGQQQAYILITALEGDGGMLDAPCRVFIPGEQELVTPSALEIWSGKKPTEKRGPVQANEKTWMVSSPRDLSFDMSISFIDPAIAVPKRAEMTILPFHGTIIQFGTSEITTL